MRVRHGADADLARGLRNVDRGDSLQHLVVLVGVDLLDVVSPRVLPSSSVEVGCPRASAREAESLIVVARGNSARPFRSGPGAKLTCGLVTEKTSASRACPAPFSRLRCRPTRWEMGTHVETPSDQPFAHVRSLRRFDKRQLASNSGLNLSDPLGLHGPQRGLTRQGLEGRRLRCFWAWL